MSMLLLIALVDPWSGGDPALVQIRSLMHIHNIVLLLASHETPYRVEGSNRLS